MSKSKLPAPTSYVVPPRDWLPLHQARFHFFPQYAPPGEAFVQKMTILAKKFVPADTIISPSTDQSRLEVKFGAVTAVIDAAVGSFWLEPTADSDLSDVFNRECHLLDDPIGDPDRYLLEATYRTFRPEYEADGPLLLKTLQEIWSSMLRSFATAVEHRDAELFGRWQAVDAPLVPIAFDQWTHLPLSVHGVEVQDGMDFRYVAQLKNDEITVYGCHVKAGTANSAEERAIAALADEMRNVPPQKTKDAIALEYSARFGLSKTAILERVWPAALARSGASAWDKPGRRSIPSQLQEQ